MVNQQLVERLKRVVRKTSMKNFMYGVIGLGFIALLGWAIYSFTTNIPASVVTPIILAGVAIYVQRETKRREIESRHFEYKIEKYSKFVDLLFRIGEPSRKGIPQNKLVEEMIELKKVIMIWGRAETIRAFQEFGKASQKDKDEMNVVLQGENIIKAIRKDLGHDDRQLKTGDLILFMIKADDQEKMRQRITEATKHSKT